jgi:mRNA-degrading endonuclease YafQ of YafQ-DinJ toxin-antitoxin module
MMNIIRSNRFLKDFKNLASKEDQKRIIRTLQLMGQNLNHPSLRIKKIQGTKSLWEASASMNLRIVFEITRDAIYLYRCGHHDVLKNFS